MDQLPDSLLLQILSRLDDSADVARCRVASKAFNTVFPGLPSINLQYSSKWHTNSKSTLSNIIPFKWFLNSRVSNIKPFKEVFLDLVSKQENVESVRICLENVFFYVDPESDDLFLADGEFAKEWLPRVSESLKSLSISAIPYHNGRQSNVFPLISAYCRNLISLTLKSVWLSVDNLSPMPMLKSLTLESTILEDEQLDELNKCFPNLQVFNLIHVEGLTNPKIHLLHLQTCHWTVYHTKPSMTLIAPNLITLRIECDLPAAVHVEAPMLSDFELSMCVLKYPGALTFKKFNNLKTLCMSSIYLESLLSEFPITKTVEKLSLDSGNVQPRPATDPNVTLRKVFTVFPNVSYLCISSGAWSEIEACLNPEDWEIPDGIQGLKTICVYLLLVDPLLTFSSVARVLDQCVCLSEVSLLINGGVTSDVSESFKSKCMARWLELKWRWGIWDYRKKDYWVTDGLSSHLTDALVIR